MLSLDDNTQFVMKQKLRDTKTFAGEMLCHAQAVNTENEWRQQTCCDNPEPTLNR